MCICSSFGLILRMTDEERKKFQHLMRLGQNGDEKAAQMALDMLCEKAGDISQHKTCCEEEDNEHVAD